MRQTFTLGRSIATFGGLHFEKGETLRRAGQTQEGGQMLGIFQTADLRTVILSDQQVKNSAARPSQIRRAE